MEYIYMISQKKNLKVFPASLSYCFFSSIFSIIMMTSPTLGEVKPIIEDLHSCSLMWHDEFDDDFIDDQKWSHRALGPRKDAIVTQDQSHLDGSGNLTIEADLVEGNVLIGMVATHKTYSKAFGYFEARVRLPKSHATRAAFWLQTHSIGKNIGLPEKNGLEIDIFEFIPEQNLFSTPWLNHALHWDGYGDYHKKKVKRVYKPVYSGGWHTFSLLWLSDRYVFFVDGRRSAEFFGPISQKDLFIVLSLELVDAACEGYDRATR